jgi:hypothetical protein
MLHRKWITEHGNGKGGKYMTRIYKTRKITKNETYIESVSCDICGVAKEYWEINHGNVNETEVSWEQGYRYPDGSSTTKLEYDICPKCFESVLMPWLLGFEAVPSKTEYDW